MVNHRKKHKRVKKHHIGSTPDAVIQLRPPSPRPHPPPPPAPTAIANLELKVNDHTHRKNHKGRVIVMIWSQRSNACYEAEFCPNCPVGQVRDSLLSFCISDAGYFTKPGWLTLWGLNDDTLQQTFSPYSSDQMADFMTLIKTRDHHGGKITLKFARKGQAVSLNTPESMK